MLLGLGILGGMIAGALLAKLFMKRAEARSPAGLNIGNFPSNKDRRLFAARAYPNFGVTEETPLGTPFRKS